MLKKNSLQDLTKLSSYSQQRLLCLFLGATLEGALRVTIVSCFQTRQMRPKYYMKISKRDDEHPLPYKSESTTLPHPPLLSCVVRFVDGQTNNEEGLPPFFSLVLSYSTG